jgi:sensor histidine kinase regulating citrate/malate metabolism
MLTVRGGTRVATETAGSFRRAAVVALQCLVVLLSVAVTSVVSFQVQESGIRESTRERVLDVARSLAGLAQVREAVAGDRVAGTASLQPLADTVQAAAGVDYVVVTDAEGIRLTHPVPAERGRPVSTDPAAVLAGETVVATQEGTLGPTLRAKVPVVDGGEVTGMVSVGILESEMAASFQEAVLGMLPWVVASAAVGSVTAALVTASLNRRVRALAAQARELRTQRRITEALREQTHEFHTRLHVVRGLVAHGESSQALAYIGRIVPVDDGGGAAGIADPRLGGLVDGLAAELRGHGTSVDASGDTPPGGMPEPMLTPISNLCRNAAEAGAATVRVRWERAGGELRMTVDDDGPGIPAETRARLFQRGVTTKPDAGVAGRGIGLSLVRREVGACGGAIEVGGSALGGARFTVTVPLAEAVR